MKRDQIEVGSVWERRSPSHPGQNTPRGTVIKIDGNVVTMQYAKKRVCMSTVSTIIGTYRRVSGNGDSMPKGQSGPNNPIPAVGSRWLNKQRRPNTSAPVVVIVDSVYKDDHRKDVRINYHREDTGLRRSCWYSAFRMHSSFEPAPMPAAPVPAKPAASPAAAAGLDASDVAAVRALLMRIADAVESLVLLWSGKPKANGVSGGGAHGSVHAHD